MKFFRAPTPFPSQVGELRGGIFPSFTNSPSPDESLRNSGGQNIPFQSAPLRGGLFPDFVNEGPPLEDTNPIIFSPEDSAVPGRLVNNFVPGGVADPPVNHYRAPEQEPYLPTYFGPESEPFRLPHESPYPDTPEEGPNAPAFGGPPRGLEPQEVLGGFEETNELTDEQRSVYNYCNYCYIGYATAPPHVVHSLPVTPSPKIPTAPSTLPTVVPIFSEPSDTPPRQEIEPLRDGPRSQVPELFVTPLPESQRQTINLDETLFRSDSESTTTSTSKAPIVRIVTLPQKKKPKKFPLPPIPTRPKLNIVPPIPTLPTKPEPVLGHSNLKPIKPLKYYNPYPTFPTNKPVRRNVPPTYRPMEETILDTGSNEYVYTTQRPPQYTTKMNYRALYPKVETTSTPSPIVESSTVRVQRSTPPHSLPIRFLDESEPPVRNQIVPRSNSIHDMIAAQIEIDQSDTIPKLEDTTELPEIMPTLSIPNDKFFEGAKADISENNSLEEVPPKK